MTQSRRHFLRSSLESAAVLSLGATAPGFLLEAAAQDTGKRGERILVIVQLSGGNDGLNTVVPHADDAYQKARPKLAIPAANLLKINDQVGLHSSLKGCAGLLESGSFSILLGVGYPEPNRSHFESMDIWHTCRRKTEARADGWLGRYLDASVPANSSNVVSLHLGEEKQPLALTAQRVRTPSIRSLERFRLQDGGNAQLVKSIQELTQTRRDRADDLLGFIQSSSTTALEASRQVEQAVGQYKTKVDYPTSGLAQKLRLVAQLIDAGMPTRIYYVTLDGFDTHSKQAAAHAGLLQEFGEACAAFVRDVAGHDHGSRVLLMAFSEFGRRLEENASEGTDHGAAAPMFLAGERVKPGLIGAYPSLTDLDDGDLKHHTDFRQVYATVLQNWLGWQSEPVLGGKYQLIDCLKGK